MPPKGKAAAKAKAGAKGKDGKDAGAEEEKPPPPPTPVLVKFSEEPGEATEAAQARCAQLAWRDKGKAYKLQGRPYLGEGKEAATEAAEALWTDVDQNQVQNRPLHGRGDVYFVTGLQTVHMEFRLAFKQQEVGMDNWCSAPTDPVATMVDPPSRPSAEVIAQSDFTGLAIRLQFGSTDPSVALSAQREAQEAGPWAAFPGLGLCRAQARWRVLRQAEPEGDRNPALARERLPPSVAEGHKEISPLFELGRAACPFDPDSGTWSLELVGVPPGLVVCAEVRMGTALRWSAWSEESEDITTAVPAPNPVSAIQVVSRTDAAAKIRWEPFELAEGLSLCEYRVTVCHLDDGPSEKEPDWYGPGAHISGIFTAVSSEDDDEPKPVEFDVRSLAADMFYAVKVDARYPFVGERGWSAPAVTEAPIHTGLGTVPPPAAPVVLATEELEAILRSGTLAGSELKLPFPERAPWLAILVETAAADDYRVEWTPSSSRKLAADKSQTDERTFFPVESAVVLGKPVIAGRESGWTALAVLLHEEGAEPPRPYESVVCRLRHKSPSIVAPHMGTGSISAPMLPAMAPPAHAFAQVRYSPTQCAHGMMVRFFLGAAAHPDEEAGTADATAAAAASRQASQEVEGGVVSGKLQACRTARHLQGHRYAVKVQVRVKAMVKEDPESEEPPKPAKWQTMPPTLMPPMKPSLTRPGPAPPRPQHAESLPIPPLVALATDAGNRHETWLWPKDGLVPGQEYEVQVRIGTTTRWSPWSQALESVSFTAPAPRHLTEVSGNTKGPLVCDPASSTAGSLKVPAPLMDPGATRVELTVTATPRFHVEEGSKERPPFATTEGIAPVVKLVTGQLDGLLQDEEFIERCTKRSIFSQEEWQGLALESMAAKLQRLLQQEREIFMGSLWSSREARPISIDLPGLLPATLYELSVVARYPNTGSEALAPESEPLTGSLQTPCGLAPPKAPVVLKAAQVGSASLGPYTRTVLLEVEELEGYCLERIDMGGWYTGPKKAGGDNEPARWWPESEDPNAEVLSGTWAKVETKPFHGSRARQEGMTWVLASLPAFGQEPGQELLDIVSFRLRSTRRGSCHPCRWIGVPSEPVAICIAPMPVQPLPRRVLWDKAWSVNVSFFVNSHSRPSGVSVAETRNGFSVGSQLQELQDPPNEREVESPEELTPEDVAADSQELAPEASHIPMGYGHRSVKWVQARVRERRTSSGWVERPEVPLAVCKADSASLFKDASFGDLHALKLSGMDTSLEQGKVYQVQLRLGDGFRWSEWSTSSPPFHFEAPAPFPAPGQLEVATLSASCARLRWPAFCAPPGVSQIDYRVLAEPVSAASGRQGAHATETAVIHPTRAPGTQLEADLDGLLPATSYVFSVAARHVFIGRRDWGSRLASEPIALEDSVADWPAPPAPAAFPAGGPRPLAVAPEGVPFYHASERALLLGFADTSEAPDGIAYRLEYRHVGLDSEDVTAPSGGEEDGSRQSCWQQPVEVQPVDLLDPGAREALAASVAPWKLPPRLWRVLLPPLDREAVEFGGGSEDLNVAHSQRVQFRLSAEARGSCPTTRWFSATSPPVCASMAPPLAPGASLLTTEQYLGIRVQFCLNLSLAPCLAGGARPSRSPEGLPSDGEDEEWQPWLPEGFGHAYATRLQLRSRHSPRPPGERVDGKRPTGVPWSSWRCSEDIAFSSLGPSQEAPDQGQNCVRHATTLELPDGDLFDFGSWYQVSVRISDGVSWSDWSKPSAPVKVYVAPPKPDHPDTDTLNVEKIGGGTVRIVWPPLRGCAGLRGLEYALFKKQVLKDGSLVCEREIAALFRGYAAGGLGDEGTTSHVVADLRQDTAYVFTLAARYPHVGPRDFEEVLNSSRVVLRPAKAPLPVPVQVPLPLERLRRLQCGARCVLLRWTIAGLSKDKGPKPGKEPEPESEQYDMQALPEGAPDDGWLPCRSVSRLNVDGVAAWLVRDVPGSALRTRFRLYERETSRFGRASPLMLSHVEPVYSVTATRVVTDSGTQIVLRAPLDGPLGTHEFVCRYQVRFQAAHIDAAWVELPIQITWHRQNDHLNSADPDTDAAGAVMTGLAEKSKEGDARPESPDPAAQATVTLPLAHPTMPLASVSSTGNVIRQRCLVAIVREEDGLNLDALYRFSVRVGDLFHMTDWSEPSEEERLGLPAPHLSPHTPTLMQVMSVSELSDTGLTVSWPQFIPATFGGVPVHAGIEYRLTVTQQPMPGDRLAARGAYSPRPERPLFEHLLASSFPPGTREEDTGQAPHMSLQMTCLSPRCQYHIALSVRYTRLGRRAWTEALSTVATTKKGLAMPQPLDPSAVQQQMASSSGSRRAALEAGPSRQTSARSEALAQSAEGWRPGSGGAASPRQLPPLGSARGSSTAVGAFNASGSQASPTAVQAGGPMLTPLESTGQRPAPPDQLEAEKEEWRASAQADLERVIGATGKGVGVAAAADQPPPAQEVEDPRHSLPHPIGREPFWKRDPSAPAGVAGRPAIPLMPPASHPAGQLELFRPRPPDAPPPARSAYPRRA